jgi:hypothetical protein
MTGPGGPVIDAIWVRRTSHPFFHAFPLIVVIEPTRRAADCRGRAPCETVVGVGGDGCASLGVFDLDDSVPGIPGEGVTFGPVPVFVWSAGGHVA